MAIAKTKFPIDKIAGILGKKDRSVGKEPGLTLNILDTRNAIVLANKTTPTATRSPGQIQRAAIYCNCDKLWETLSFQKASYCRDYHTKIRHLSFLHMTEYLAWMSLCMSQEWDELLFYYNSYVSRYVIKNETKEAWINENVTLINIPYLQPSGKDITVRQTDFYNKPLNTIEHVISSPGNVIVCLPDMDPNTIIYIDVYSYGNYESVENCSAAGQSGFDESMLNDTNFNQPFWSGHDASISYTPSISGYLYAYLLLYSCGSGTNTSNLISSIGPVTFIGGTGKFVYGHEVGIWSLGYVKKNTPYTISGYIYDPGGEACGCGTPSVSYPVHMYYSGPHDGYHQNLESGLWSPCGGEFLPWETYLLAADTPAEIPPDSIIQIGPL